MVVYVEYVLIDNFIIDYALLKATFVVLGQARSRRRLIVSAGLGSLFALILPVIERYSALLILYKIVSGLLILIIAKRRYTFREFYLSALVFFSLTFATGGVIIGVSNLLGLEASGEVFVATVFIPVYFILKFFIKLIGYFYRKKTDLRFYYKAQISVGEKRILATAFLDTGNTLYEGNNPVILCGKGFAKKLIGDRVLKVKPRKIILTTAIGKSENFVFTASELRIYIGDEPNIYNNVAVCIANEELFDGYEIILHPKFVEGKEDASFIKIKKVS